MLPGLSSSGEGERTMSTKELKRLSDELAAIERLIRQTHDLHQRRYLHMRAWQLLDKLKIKASA